MSKLIRGVLTLLVLVTAWSFGGPAIATEAAPSTRCQVIQGNYVRGTDWTRLHAARVCEGNTYTNGAVSGVASLTLNKIIVRYDDAHSPFLQVQKTTTHELTHVLEWQTTAAMRTKLYGYLGVTMDGDYFSIPTVSGADLEAWKASARERLAESNVKCTYGSNSFDGMSLVADADCAAFLADIKLALSQLPA